MKEKLERLHYPKKWDGLDIYRPVNCTKQQVNKIISDTGEFFETNKSLNEISKYETIFDTYNWKKIRVYKTVSNQMNIDNSLVLDEEIMREILYIQITIATIETLL
jgi:hypothetical protein